MTAQDQSSLFDAVIPAERAGFRLHRLEVYNWGTFHERVWALECRGDNALLTGDIGSGKSTLVDALTTLLVPPQKAAYNRAAGAESRERTARSYVLGVYKSERGQDDLAVRAVSLRDGRAYSVILAHFHNEGFAQTVTLAQVFWLPDPRSQPQRLYVVADTRLSVTEHFAEFGGEISGLRRRLRGLRNVETFETFPPYASAFRLRFDVKSDQAFELFHQTVSMKSVGDLTDFVRSHMLQAFDVTPRIEALLQHFEDLSRAHAAVLHAKAQIELLAPIVANCGRYAGVEAECGRLRSARDALRAWFSASKEALLVRRIANLDAELARLDDRLSALEAEGGALELARDDLRTAIAASGGDRLERLRVDLRRLEDQRSERAERARRYDTLAEALGLPPSTDDEVFTDNRGYADVERIRVDDALAQVQNELTEAGVELRSIRELHRVVADELESLRRRRSNIPARMLHLRDALCRALGLASEDVLPFAGEVLQVREEERAAWEGALERLLRSFGMSLLVPDALYARVAEYVDRTPLGERLVYFRVRPPRNVEHVRGEAGAAWRKLSIKPDTEHYAWLESELSRRFDHVCCDDLNQFRRERKAITRAGQVRGGEERHEKDDRHRLEDRTRYVLGWTNLAKIEALERQAADLERRGQSVGGRIEAADTRRRHLQKRLQDLGELGAIARFSELDWRSVAREIQRLQDELNALEASSDKLHTLQGHFREVEEQLRLHRQTVTATAGERGNRQEKRAVAERTRQDCHEVVAATPASVRDLDFPFIEQLRAESVDSTLTVESCDGRERELREVLQRRIDTEERRLSRLRDEIVAAMQDFRMRYPKEAQDADASVAAAEEYSRLLRGLQADDLPRFEAQFKTQLNENTIREVANFQSQLNRERSLIRERIDLINRSLADIDYNPGRFIRLEPEAAPDVEVREFQQELRACTEGALTGSDDETYSEAKFLQVSRIIERFKGRGGSTEVDRHWTAKVTDVRHWFVFSASERWREDDREHEHYTDSGGKSGGQKEKLAYTVLAASLAYQFGLEWSGRRSRSFRFVVIDEAFGRGSDESTRYGLALFEKLHLQLLIVTPLQKIHVIEPYVATVGFVHNDGGKRSMLRNLTIDEYRSERDARAATPT